MKLKGQRHVFMDETPGAGGGGAAAPAAAPAPATASPAPSPAPAAAPAAGGADGAGGGGAAGGSSALSAGATGADSGAGGGDGGARADAKPWAWIPEKFQVKKEDGSIDYEASARKVEEHRTNLEKRLGEGGVRPKAPSDYKMPALPEALKDMPLDEKLTAAWQQEAHDMGLSQAQFEKVMGKYFDLAPQLVMAGAQLSSEDAIASLKKTWGDDYGTKSTDAWRGITQIAKSAGLTVSEVDKELGNSPVFNRIMAAVGAQLKEDTSVDGGGGGGGGSGDAAALQQSEAFRNPRHPDHAAVSARWLKLVAGNVKDEPVIS